MLPEYQERPQDFSRRILAWGSDEEMMSLEERLLTLRKEHFGVRYYNRIVSYGNFGLGGEFNGRYKDGRRSDPVARAAYLKKYRKDNKETIAANRKKYRKDNKETIAASHKKYKKGNRELLNKRERERYHRNKQQQEILREQN